MSDKKIVHEIKLQKSVVVILGALAFGLVANVFKPAFNIEEAFASTQVHKIAICTSSGEYCAGVTKGRNGHLMVVN